eukprot:m.87067 g.87067  ORF g.87067 m.87067 type:complete len:321 (-) comp17999_c0_seq4:26-988(-)
MDAGSKRVNFSEEVEVRSYLPKRGRLEDEESEEAARPGEQHTIDSDEEDEEVQAEKLRSYKFAEEDQHEDLDEEFRDGGTTVTPFNLTEEMEEGHFDEAGNYFEDKDAYKGDEWLDGVAVFEVKDEKAALKDEAAPDPPKRTRKQLFEALLALLKPQETVTQALRRLGGQPSRKPQLAGAAKKDKPQTDSVDKAAFDDLTKVADELLSDNYFDVYQNSREKVQAELQKLESTKSAETDDMFADDFEGEAAHNAPDDDDDEVVMFEYKWTEDDGAEVYGPFPAQQMKAWQDEGKFGSGVFYREVGKGQFYSSNRADFDLYI